MAMRAATSSLPSFERARAAGPGLPRPSGRSMPSRPIRRRPQLSPPTSLPHSRAAGRSTRAAAAGTATPAKASTSAVPSKRPRSHARAGHGCRRQSAGSSRSLWPSDGRTRPYEAYRARGVSRDGRRFGGDRPSPYHVAETPAGKINTTDPNSRLLKAAGGYVQGDNAQAAVNERQIVLAAEIAVDSPDFGQLDPMVEATASELERAGITDSQRDPLAVRSRSAQPRRRR
jgi:hypothetical protein